MIIGLFYKSFRVIMIKRNAEELECVALTLRQYINFSALLIIRHYSGRYKDIAYSFFASFSIYKLKYAITLQ